MTFDKPGFAVRSVWQLGDIIKAPGAALADQGGIRFFTAADGSESLCFINNSYSAPAEIYCMSIERDQITGCVKNFTSTTDPAFSAPDYAFTITPGQDGFDYVVQEGTFIGQGTWGFDATTGKPNALNIPSKMDAGDEGADILEDSYVYGLGFSSIAMDPNDPSRPLLFMVSTSMHLI